MLKVCGRLWCCMEPTDAGRAGEAMNAYEYAVDALRAADEPMSPKKLADGYGVSGGHMRSVLCDLVDDGEAERIAHGRYIEGPGPESKELDIQADTSAQDTANTARSGDIQADASLPVSPGWALVGATVVVAVVVIASAGPAEPTEPVEDDEPADPAEGWA